MGNSTTRIRTKLRILKNMSKKKKAIQTIMDAQALIQMYQSGFLDAVALNKRPKNIGKACKKAFDKRYNNGKKH